MIADHDATTTTASTVDPSDAFGYYVIFRVELPGDPMSITSDEARASVSSAIIAAVQQVSAQHALSVDYSVAYECRTRIPIPVVPHG
jgi:hypothetical protein